METASLIVNAQKEIVEEFLLFDNWEDKYSHIIDLGKQLPLLDQSLKIEDNKIKGCQSQVWLNSKLQNKKVYFESDSDSSIVKGLVSLLIRVYSGNSPDDILNAELNFLNEIGMSQHLSPTRSNGLASTIKQIKMRALAYKASLS